MFYNWFETYSRYQKLGSVAPFQKMMSVIHWNPLNHTKILNAAENATHTAFYHNDSLWFLKSEIWLDANFCTPKHVSSRRFPETQTLFQSTQSLLCFGRWKKGLLPLTPLSLMHFFAQFYFARQNWLLYSRILVFLQVKGESTRNW